MNTIANSAEPLSTRLRAWRMAQHLSQPQAATRLGVSVTTVRNWESGRRGSRLAPATRMQLERVLGGAL